MKTHFFAIFTFISLGFLMQEAMSPALAASSKSSQKYVLDLQKSKVEWSGKFTALPVHASAKFKSGEFVVKNSTISSGSVLADMKSITSDSGMDDQFKGSMLLDVEKYPTAEFKLKKFTELKAFAPGGPNARVEGTLTFKGKTKPVEAEFVLTMDADGFHTVGKVPTSYGKMVDGEATYEIWAKKK